MQPRQSILEIFSTFLQFDGDRPSTWATDARLRRNMLHHLEQTSRSETSENFWALYWHKLWQAQPASLASAHLSAHLQEACYWAARKIALSFASSQYSLSDCFQIAIAGIDKILRGFDPKQGSNLRSYASILFSTAIRETLRQRQAVDICTDWSLLRKLSQRRLVEALKNMGLAAETIASYVLAWKCFKTIYIPTQATGTSKLPKPDRPTWEAIAQCFNSQRTAELPASSPKATPEILEKWLVASVKAARSYLYPTLVSVDAPKPGQESGELLDNLPQGQGEALLAGLIAQEEEQSRETYRAQIAAVLTEALLQLNPESQTLLQMYYSQGLTQQQMAEQLQMQQYAISRRLHKARGSLLLGFARWSQETLHISPTSDLLKHASTILEEWLSDRFSRPNPP